MAGHHPGPTGQAGITDQPAPWLPSVGSLEANGLGAEGGKAIAEALKVNTSITNIK